MTVMNSAAVKRPCTAGLTWARVNSRLGSSPLKRGPTTAAGLPARGRAAASAGNNGVGVSQVGRQAADVMGTAPQTVANQVTAALAQLRRELSELIAEVVGVRC